MENKVISHKGKKAGKLDKGAVSLLIFYGLITLFALLVILEAWNS